MSQKSNDSNDLNPYELQRLENIKRNEEFLITLGIGSIKQEIHEKSEEVKDKANDSLKERKRKITVIENSNSKTKQNGNVDPPRRSKRLSGEVMKVEEEEAPLLEEEGRPRDYSLMPLVRIVYWKV